MTATAVKNSNNNNKSKSCNDYQQRQQHLESTADVATTIKAKAVRSTTTAMTSTTAVKSNNSDNKEIIYFLQEKDISSVLSKVEDLKIKNCFLCCNFFAD
jgi:hypothetical protein